jgi:DNA-binding transcriptional ArsR family regulator
MLLSDKERNVTEICSDLGSQSQPAVSHHLALLRHGRLIEPRRSGKHNYYYLTEQGRELAKVVNNLVG